MARTAWIAALLLSACGGVATSQTSTDEQPDANAGWDSSPTADSTPWSGDGAGDDDVQEGSTSADAFPPPDAATAPKTIHAVGCSHQGEYVTTYWRGDVDSNAPLEPMVLGPWLSGPSVLAVVNDQPWVMSGTGTVYVINTNKVDKHDLAAMVGSPIHALGLHADGGTVYALTQRSEDPSIIDLFTWKEGSITHQVTTIPQSPGVGATGLIAGQLVVAGTFLEGNQNRVSRFRLQQDTWTATEQTLETGWAEVYALASAPLVTHVVGMRGEHGGYWRFDAGGVALIPLPHPLAATLASAVELDGDAVLVAGVATHDQDWVETTPLYWRIANGGLGTAQRVDLPFTAVEAWATSIRVNNGVVYVGGTLGDRAALWVDEGADGVDLHTIEAAASAERDIINDFVITP